MAAKKYEIDPALFTNSQWEELAACSSMVPADYDTLSRAKPFKRTAAQIREAIDECAGKADYVEEGLYGSNRDTAAWADDLRGAADVLASILGPDRFTKKQARIRLRHLLYSDIYTDAPEYSRRIEEIHELIPLVLK